MKLEILIDISNIVVDEKYFSFDYNIKINWKVIKTEIYNSDYSWYSSIDEFKKVLLDWRAYQCVLDSLDLQNYI